MYKSAFLGCGGRARGHAQAYQHVKGGEIVAICDMNEQLLNTFGDDFGIIMGRFFGRVWHHFGIHV